MFEGLSVAMVTPFRNGVVDHAGIERLVARLIEGGVDGIVALGSTGEAATQNVDERRAVLRQVIAQARGHVWVVAGTGTNNTAESIALTQMAKDEGADGAMLVTPYYNKPTPDGQVAHVEAIARAVPMPFIVYNVPGRTGTHMTPETIARLSRLPEVAAVKEASGSLDQVSAILDLCDITVLCGDDSLTLPMIAVGAQGVVSVLAQVVPAEMKALVDASRHGRLGKARVLHKRLFPLARALFLESNPGPVKEALAQLGVIEPELRLPLVRVRQATADALASELARFAEPRAAAVVT
jgi:4-hydroxy-tetrahydrodipicolinate synthase